MSIGIRAARVRPLGIRRFFRPEVKHHLEPDEQPELANYRNCLPQTELTSRLIDSDPYISLSGTQHSMGFTTIRKVPHERSWGTTELERRFGIERVRAMRERCACSAGNFSLFVLIWMTEDGWSDSDAG